MRDTKKTPLQAIIDSDVLTPDGAYYAKMCADTTLWQLDHVLQKGEFILARKAKEARERGDVPDGDNLTQDRFLFSKARQALNEQHPPAEVKSWVVIYDRDWGLRGERRKYRAHFKSYPTPEQIEAAFDKRGLTVRSDWQEPSCSGVITVQEIEFDG